MDAFNEVVSTLKGWRFGDEEIQGKAESIKAYLRYGRAPEVAQQIAWKLEDEKMQAVLNREGRKRADLEEEEGEDDPES